MVSLPINAGVTASSSHASFLYHTSVVIQASSERDRTPRHTILLIQVTASPASRTYLDFTSKTKAFDGFLRLFEEDLKSHSKKATITYDVADLYKYMDTLGDVSCLM
jgi:hypothetical protein